MKKCFIASSLLSLSLSHAVLAEDACVVLGVHEPHTQIYDGPTFCSDVYINNIDVRGPLMVSGSRLKGITKVSGELSASYTCFDHIDIQNTGSHHDVSISDHSIVKGNVVFEGGKNESGIYNLDNTSVIYGNVINGSPG